MIFARAQGRLGNQLFFLSALLRAKSPKEVVFATGFRQLMETFPTFKEDFPRFYNLSKNRWKSLRADKFLSEAVKLRFAGLLSLSSTNDNLTRSPAFTKGVVLSAGYFQDERLIDEAPIVALRNGLATRERSFTEKLGLSQNGQNLRPRCFVHVRRGDYLKWPDAEYPAALPAGWYRQQIESIRQSQPSTGFLVFSDDIAFCRGEFRGIQNLDVVEANVAQTFLAMSLCDSAVLSASSLSWWGAKLASTTANGPFLAPKHWFFWPRGHWREDDTLRHSSFLEWRRVVGDDEEGGGS
jgi:hypothetical protein